MLSNPKVYASSNPNCSVVVADTAVFLFDPSFQTVLIHLYFGNSSSTFTNHVIIKQQVNQNVFLLLSMFLLCRHFGGCGYRLSPRTVSADRREEWKSAHCLRPSKKDCADQSEHTLNELEISLICHNKKKSHFVNVFLDPSTTELF